MSKASKGKSTKKQGAGAKGAKLQDLKARKVRPSVAKSIQGGRKRSFEIQDLM